MTPTWAGTGQTLRSSSYAAPQLSREIETTTGLIVVENASCMTIMALRTTGRINQSDELSKLQDNSMRMGGTCLVAGPTPKQSRDLNSGPVCLPVTVQPI